ncbi:deazapurine DNA modification protein DpdA family protein [Thermococcus thioreducens]|uniref:DeoxyPurine in DNA protein A domain-containing protein n=1 Tax=Thermococcus thioreducens TaxID=277988 RepID=A0A0Q2QT68_9EURY|nr:hypothetical protein [Thermococcus thioreducens]ASJ13390.1 hypothetical protein A3L14_11080 [Thermococcus thioreducens]KQH83205.1 hypothetical protein AMR53_00535 [Thermococcus thioreducens]SEW23717.1 hypothetical protein SAMN05216170_2326 [Thermococcus thioreducens]
MELFFFGVADGSARKAIESFAPRKFPIMVNYATKVRPIPRNTSKLFIDSGGFSFFFKLREYPDPHEKYLEFVLKKNADFFANRDHPCEPEVLHQTGRTVRENQLKTIENQIAIQDLIDDQYPELGNRFVAVLQGWTIEEYLYMLDEMKSQGLLTRLIGIGSVCRRGQERQIRRIITTLRAELPRKYGLHAFGVKFSVLKYKDVWDALYSADSLAYRWRIDRVKDPRPISEQLIERLNDWISRLDSLATTHSNQMTLVEAI